MKDEEIEEMLSQMPLKEPKRLPASLSAPSRAGGMLRAIVGFKVPAWQAAAAVLIALLLYGGIANLSSNAPAEPASSGHRVEETLSPAPPGNASASVNLASSADRFWLLPERYQKELQAARERRQ